MSSVEVRESIQYGKGNTDSSVGDTDETSSLLPDAVNGIEETLLEMLMSCRWVMAYAGFICCILVYALRVNMSIALACMVKGSNTTETNNGSVCGVQSSVGGDNSTSQKVSGDIDWDADTQGWILSSFYYGYIVTHVLGGYLAGRYGGKIVILVGMSIYGVVTIAVPVAARLAGVHYTVTAYLIIGLRVLAGLSTGVVIPAIENLIGRWAPLYERSKIYGLTLSGTIIGTVVVLGTGGFFCEWTAFDGGWPSMFYLGGGCCLSFCLLWWFVVFDSPSEHPRITEKEKRYILVSTNMPCEKNTHVPWVSIVKSPAVWAVIAVSFCDNFGKYLLLTDLPMFMKDNLGFKIMENGLLSALFYIVEFVIANIGAHTADALRKRKIVSTAFIRKLFTLVATWIPALFLVAIGYVPCGMDYLAAIFLVITIGSTGLHICGASTNVQDIAPRYAGEIASLANLFTTIPGLIAPPIVNAMTVNNSIEEWRTVFYVWAAIYVTGGLFYAKFARGELQPWAVDKEK